jgi:hypothetical protein
VLLAVPAATVALLGSVPVTATATVAVLVTPLRDREMSMVVEPALTAVTTPWLFTSATVVDRDVKENVPGFWIVPPCASCAVTAIVADCPALRARVVTDG